MKILCALSRFAYGKEERGENYDYVHFLPALRRMGHDVRFIDTGARDLHGDFGDLNLDFVKSVVEFQPDVIFCVLMHYEIWLETLDLVRAKTPAVLINWGTDDSWKFSQASRYFAQHVDLHVTTSSVAARAAKSEGLGNVMLSQWAAADDKLAAPTAARDCIHPVSFVGSQYGYRAEWLAELRRAGVEMVCFGHGSENGVVAADRIPEIFNKSMISLNFSGGTGNAPLVASDNRQIKARTFEVPGAGGFLLTERAPDLERYFTDGTDVATFASPSELIEKVRYYMAHSDERDRIAASGFVHTRDQHTYQKRFADIFDNVSDLLRTRSERAWSLSLSDLADAVKRHRKASVFGLLRSAFTQVLCLIFGSERGKRAARRIVYEISWRVCGASTYSARGLPGRLFYRES